MIGSLKVVSFKGKNHLLTTMPIYIKNKTIYGVVFLFLIFILLAVIFFRAANSEGASDEFIRHTLVFFVVMALFLLFFLVQTLKAGSFVMAADEKGIYYRIYGRRDEFMLIEWGVIDEIVDSYSDGVAQLDVLTVIKVYDLPAPCNAVTYKPHPTEKWPATKNIAISFIIPNFIKSAEIKRRLDELRIKSQKALLA
ncbi:MAG: hypothetical protein PHU14_10080 [Methylovulum sp.]|nr:hypothetical protein [Methylovulum sp.]